jgi:hypothetical protein
MTFRKDKARGEAGSKNVAGREAKATKKNILKCGAHHISNVKKQLREYGVALRSTYTDTQKTTLLRALKLRGKAGLNTYEGTAAGYARLATRVFELQVDGWRIDSIAEDVIGPDGLYHKNIARYVLRGKRADAQDPQLTLGLEGA